MRRIKPMLLCEDEKHLDNPNFLLEEKYDGTRCILIKHGLSIKLMSRSWHEYTDLFPTIIRQARKIRADSCVLDGELAFFKHGRDFFLTIAAKPETRKGFTARYMVFDVLEVNGRDVKLLPILKRKRILKKIIPDLSRIKNVRYIFKNKREVYERIISGERQAEGVVLKRKGSRYYEGTRSSDWLKVKSWKDADCVIVGVTKGTGARKATFGALILGQFKDGALIPVGTASGFKEYEQIELLKKLQKSLSPPSSEFTEKYKDRVKFWVIPDTVCVVKYMERTKYGVLRFPSFQHIRTDKKPEECIF